jgi:hypothetical protein
LSIFAFDSGGAADGLAHDAFRGADGALPAGALLFRAVEELGAELPVRVHEALRQERRGLVDDVERLPGLERVDRRGGEDRGDLRQGGVLADDGARRLVETRFLEVDGPREARRVLVELGEGHRVVGLVAVAALRARPVRLGDLGLEGHDVGGVLRGLSPAGERQQVGDVLLVTVFLRLEVVAQVELAVGEAEAGLPDVERVLFRVLGVIADAGVEERAAEARRRAAHRAGDIVERLLALDGVEVRLDRLRVELLRGRLIERRPVQRGGLRLVRAGLEILVGGPAVEDRPDLHFGGVAEHVERSETGLVGRDLRGRDPLAVDVLEEVVARLDGGVHALNVEAPRAVLLRGDLVGGGGVSRVHGGREEGKHGKQREKPRAHQFPLSCLDGSGRRV